MSRKLLGGLAVLAVLSAGAFWSARRRQPPPAPPAPPAESPSAQTLASEEAPPPESQAWLVMVKGAVYLRLRDHPPRSVTPAAADAPLEPGDMVLTGRDGAAEIALARGSLIRLGANSALALNSLEEGDEELYLGLGSLVGKIRAVLGGGELRFRTPTAVAAVRGTELAVVYDRASRTTRAGVFREGALAVRSGAGETALRAGQETAVKPGQAPVAAAPLAALKPLKARVEEVSRRAESLGAAWVPKSEQEQEASRQRLLEQKTVAIESLKNLEGVLKPSGSGVSDPEDPLQPMRQKLREDVQRKMARDKSMEPVRRKMREDVQKKMEREKEGDANKQRLREEVLRRMEEERRRREQGPSPR